MSIQTFHTASYYIITGTQNPVGPDEEKHEIIFVSEYLTTIGYRAFKLHIKVGEGNGTTVACITSITKKSTV